MIRDPIVDEVHAIREAMLARLDGDLRAMCEDVRRGQAAAGIALVAYPPRRVDPPETTPTKKAS